MENDQPANTQLELKIVSNKESPPDPRSDPNFDLNTMTYKKPTTNIQKQSEPDTDDAKSQEESNAIQNELMIASNTNISYKAIELDEDCKKDVYILALLGHQGAWRVAIFIWIIQCLGLILSMVPHETFEDLVVSAFDQVYDDLNSISCDHSDMGMPCTSSSVIWEKETLQQSEYTFSAELILSKTVVFIASTCFVVDQFFRLVYIVEKLKGLTSDQRIIIFMQSSTYLIAFVNSFYITFSGNQVFDIFANGLALFFILELDDWLYFTIKKGYDRIATRFVIGFCGVFVSFNIMFILSAWFVSDPDYDEDNGGGQYFVVPFFFAGLAFFGCFFWALMWIFLVLFKGQDCCIKYFSNSCCECCSHKSCKNAKRHV